MQAAHGPVGSPTALRTLLLVAGAVLVLAMSACGDDENSSDAAPSGTPTTAASNVPAGIKAAQDAVAQYKKDQPPLEIPPLSKPVKPGLTLAAAMCTVPTCQVATTKEAVAKIGWKLKLIGFDLTKGPPALATAFDTALQAKPSGGMLFTYLFPKPTIAKQLAAAEEQGIALVSQTGTKEPEIPACFACGALNELTGRLMVDTALADAGKKTKIAWAIDPVFTALQQNLKGAKAALEEHGEGSTMDVVNLSYGKQPAANAATITSFLQSHPDVEYVLFPTSELLGSVPQQLQSSGLGDKVKLISGNTDGKDLPALRSGQLFASVATENSSNQWRAVDALARLSVGEELTPDLAQPAGWHQIITKETATGDEQPQPPNYKAIFAKAWGAG